MKVKTHPSWAGKVLKGPRQLKVLRIRFLHWANLQKEKSKSQPEKI